MTYRYITIEIEAFGFTVWDSRPHHFTTVAEAKAFIDGWFTAAA